MIGGLPEISQVFILELLLIFTIFFVVKLATSRFSTLRGVEDLLYLMVSRRVATIHDFQICSNHCKSCLEGVSTLNLLRNLTPGLITGRAKLPFF